MDFTDFEVRKVSKRCMFSNLMISDNLSIEIVEMFLVPTNRDVHS